MFPNSSFIPAISLLILTVACTSPGAQDTVSDTESVIPQDKWDNVEDWKISNPKESTRTRGYILMEMDNMVTAWNNLLLSAGRGADQQKFRVLDEKISHRAAKDLRIFLEELETGPTRNRQVSAMALGFSRSERAMAPLLAALEDNSSTVRANAALALGLLSITDTPLGGLIAMLEAEEAGERGNASWAIAELLKSGADGAPALEGARHGLFDTEPSVQVHCVLILARLGDSESLSDMSLMLRSDHLLVVRAASRAITKLGLDDSHSKGRAARILTAALLENKEGQKRASLLRNLQLLSSSNYGDEDTAWIEWANRLPEG
jgi:hypothetical protein